MTAPCSPGCGAEFTSSFSVDPTVLPEGRNVLRLSSADAAGNSEVGDSLVLIVDHTPPAAPGDVRVSSFDPSTGEATLDWTPGIDPDLATDLPGAGANASEYRVERGGVWSGWTRVGTSFAVLAAATEGESFPVEVRSIDDVGNVSPVAEGTVTVSDLDDESSGSARTTLASDGPGFESCTPRIDYARSRVEAARPRDFVEARNTLGAQLKVYCIVTRTSKIKLSGGFAIVVDANTSKELNGEQDLGTKEARMQRDVVFRGVNYGCEAPRAAVEGQNEYLVAGEIKYIRDGAVDVTRDYYTDKNHPARLWCPTADVRQARVEDAWRVLSRNTPSASHNPTTARKQLKRVLGDAPYAPTGTSRAWEAHHVVPYQVPHQNQDAVKLHVALFRCAVHPNSTSNGLYLRGYGLKKRKDGRDNPKYATLRSKRPDLAARSYHGDTFGNDYIGLLTHEMNPAASRDECVGTKVRDGLGRTQTLLRQGRSGIEKADS